MRAWALLALLSLPLTAAAQVTPAPQKAALQGLADDYWKLSMEAGPETAFSLYGLETSSAAPVLADLAPATRAANKTELAALLKRLGAIESQVALYSSEDRVDIRLLETLIRMDIRQLDEKVYQTSLLSYAIGPVFYLNARQAAFAAGKGSADEWAGVARVLEALPGYYAGAKANVREGLKEGKKPYKFLIERYLLKQTEDAAVYYEVGVPTTAAAALGAADAAAARVKAAGGPAAKAARDFAAFMKDEVVPKSGEVFALGSDETDYRLAAELGPGMTADKAIARLDGHAKELDARIAVLEADLAKELGVPKGKVMETIWTLPTDDADILKRYRDSAVRAEAFIRKKGLIDLPKGYSVDIKPAPESTASFGAYYQNPPSLKDGVKGTFFVALTGGDNKKLSEHGVPMIAPTAVHEALPGHDVQYAKFREAKGSFAKSRWLADSRSNLEGWAMYVTDLMAKNGFFTKAEQYAELVGERWATRLAALDVAIHAGKKTLSAAVDEVVKVTGSSRDAALENLYRSFAVPLYSANYIIGQVQIEDLKADYKKRMGLKYSEAQFHKEFLARGPIPVWMIRESLFPTPGWLEDMVVKSSQRMTEKIIESVEDMP